MGVTRNLTLIKDNQVHGNIHETGIYDNSTYTYGSVKLYVMVPNEETVTYAKNNINSILGETH